MNGIAERNAWAWALAVLFGLLALFAATLSRDDWPGFVGDEATYLLAAESLAWDGDYLYERGDYDRFVDHWGKRPEFLLFLQSDDSGRTLVYSKPFFYPLFAAPFARVSPTHGPLVANVLLAALAAWFVSRALRPRLGAEAPLWVATFFFGSVAFAYTVWAHADSFLMSLTAISLSLAAGWRRREEASRGLLAACFVAGVLAAMVAFSRPFYAVLFLPLAVALPRRRRLAAAGALAAGALMVALFAAWTHWQLAGALTSYTGERGGFYARVGLPEVDFPGETWDEAIRRTGNFAWYQAREPLEQETRVGLWGWNLAYFLAGRHVGLLPYFLPVVLGLAWIRFDRWRLALLAAAAAAMAAFFLYRPFNFFGGGAAIGNRYFLPIYPLAWFLVARPRAAWARRLAPAATLAVAALFLWPVWTDLGEYPLTSEQSHRFVAPTAKGLLPYETTQSHLKPGGQEDKIHHGFWVRVLRPGTRVMEDRIWTRSGEWASLLIAIEDEPPRLRLFGPAGTGLEVEGAQVSSEQRAGEVTEYLLEFSRPRARHAMWWRWEPLALYLLEFRFAGAEGEVVGSYLEAPE